MIRKYTPLLQTLAGWFDNDQAFQKSLGKLAYAAGDYEDAARALRKSESG
jgi:uncharacterized protein HemY